jgi:FKBP-type peptidyl-prolyl cis-trans isomerase
MKISKLILLSVFAFLVLISSCKSDEPSAELLKWKSDNEAFFSSMKDSADYSSYNIPSIRGGGNFYYKIKAQGDSLSGSPAYNSTVKVNYRGKMVDGYIFDQSFIGIDPRIDSTAKPITYYANGFIPGWTENLMQMKTGEIRTIVLPQELGYGINGQGIIPPYSTLIFDVQLISYGQ